MPIMIAAATSLRAEGLTIAAAMVPGSFVLDANRFTSASNCGRRRTAHLATGQPDGRGQPVVVFIALFQYDVPVHANAVNVVPLLVAVVAKAAQKPIVLSNRELNDGIEIRQAFHGIHGIAHGFEVR